jgi:signal transduction histidine kinase
MVNMMKKILSLQVFILTLLLLLLHPVHSQHIDSLYTVFSHTKGQKQIIIANTILQYAYENEFMDNDLITLKSSDEQALVYATVYEAMGNYYSYEQADYVKSIEFLKQALENYEKTGNTAAVYSVQSNIASDYGRMGDYENAVAYMLKCYEWEKSVNDLEGLSSTLNDLGIMYSQWQQRDLAIRYFEEAEKVERPLNRPLYYANRLASLAKEYSFSDAKKALPLIKEALQYDQKIDSEDKKEDRIAIHNIILGDIYYELDSLKSAENCYKKSLGTFEKKQRTFYIANTLLALGRLQAEEKQYHEAITTLKQCNEIAERNGLLRLQHDACQFLSEAYSKLEPNALSYLYMKKYFALHDSIFTESSQKQISHFQVKYETIEKQLEIERQKDEIARQRTKQFMFIGGLIAAGLLLSLFVYIVILHIHRNRVLSEINTLKDKFFHIISHDLKNPAVAQRDSLQILADNADQLAPHVLAEYYQKLLKSGNGMVDLIKNLFNWAQIQTEREIYHPITFNFVAALQSDLDVIKNMAEHKNIVFEALLPPTALITADEKMLVTIVRNLLTNAVKFTPEGGRVALEIARKDESTKARMDDEYIISVADTGVGMSQEHITNLFRLDSVHSQRGTAGEHGSGLGLIVCKEMLEKHRSALHIESIEGKGSRFWFEM